MIRSDSVLFYGFKFLLLLAIIAPCLNKAYCQDSLKVNRKIKFGMQYNVNAGYFYAHSLGGIMSIRNKHQLEINGILFPGINPIKDRMDYGAAVNYNFFPNGAEKKSFHAFRAASAPAVFGKF